MRALVASAGSTLDLCDQVVDTSMLTDALTGTTSGIGTRTAPSSIGPATEVRELYLRRCQLDTKGAAMLAPVLSCPQLSLTCLSLCDNRLGDAGAAWLARSMRCGSTGGSSSLLTLRLSRNSIGDQGARHIAHALSANRSLTTLWLNANEVGPVGAASLARGLSFNQSLTRIDLDRNRIADAGAASLAGALEKNTALQVVFLAGNEIDDSGAVALAASLRVNSTLKEVRLGGNRFAYQGTCALSAAFQVNDSVIRYDCNGPIIHPALHVRRANRATYLQSAEHRAELQTRRWNRQRHWFALYRALSTRLTFSDVEIDYDIEIDIDGGWLDDEKAEIEQDEILCATSTLTSRLPTKDRVKRNRFAEFESASQMHAHTTRDRMNVNVDASMDAEVNCEDTRDELESLFGLCIPVGKTTACDDGINGLPQLALTTDTERNSNDGSYDNILDLAIGPFEDDFNPECRVNEEQLLGVKNSNGSLSAQLTIALALTYMPADVFRSVADFL